MAHNYRLTKKGRNFKKNIAHFKNINIGLFCQNTHKKRLLLAKSSVSFSNCLSPFVILNPYSTSSSNSSPSDLSEKLQLKCESFKLYPLKLSLMIKYIYKNDHHDCVITSYFFMKS